MDGAQKYRQDKKKKKEREGYELLRIKKQYQKLLREESFAGRGESAETTSDTQPELQYVSAEPNHEHEVSLMVLLSSIKWLTKMTQKQSTDNRLKKTQTRTIAKAKSQPFAKAQRERTAKQIEQQKQREADTRQRQEELAGRAKYFKQRKVQIAKHTQKTKSGQPVFANQIDAILTKLKKSNK
ncbi:hypothetical protein HK100_004666 [Physocladia obscura]|uniref:rRNA-processing protein FYV7 n=1 Tax=Physocladia obscura TaxID=109957 RepID=A0AAD5SVD2_9FUNG|nr:hypothetical protein HK100_004666 [Physocladia obscura]